MTTNTTSRPWGGTADEWHHFAHTLGLAEDLLPVVSNPNALISPNSKMKDMGKTPSHYNRDHQVVGIPEWTRHKASDRDIKRWSADSDLGICVQTRNVRAIDVDIADPVHALRVWDAIDLQLDELLLPVRNRENSGKFLLAFRLGGEFVKRVIRTEHGIIEFLATGQQFIAIGTHPSGAHYAWGGGDALPPRIPELTIAQFEALWATLATLFAVEPSVTGRGLSKRPLIPRSADDIEDPVIAYLQDQGWIKGFQRDGRVDVRCPWEGEHTSDTGDSASTWFPAGVGGFEQGHYRCLHAHCEHRTDSDFLHETGYLANDFEVLPAGAQLDDSGRVLETKVSLANSTSPNGSTPIAPAEPPPLPPFQRARNGAILSTVVNLAMAVRRPDICQFHVAYDEFLDAIMLADPHDYAGDAVAFHNLQWRPFTDADYTRLRITLERRKFEGVGKEMIRDVVTLVAAENRMDSAIEWLEHRVPQWDGVPRVKHFWTTYFGAKDSEYVQAVGLYTWSALAGRVLTPGVQIDMVPVLIGKQGTGKTSGVKALAPAHEFFAELSLHSKDEDLARRQRGKLVVELGELRGLNSRDGDSIKQWISRTHEEWIPKFKEFGNVFARRNVMFGTINKDEFLADDEGEERRWLPFRVGDTDMAALKRDRDQLWAEGKMLYENNGVAWSDAQRLARDVHAQHRISDPWEPAIEAWLNEPEFGDNDDGAPPRGAGRIRAEDILSSALGFSTQNIARPQMLRVGAVLRKFGYEKQTQRVGGRLAKVWVHGSTADYA